MTESQKIRKMGISERKYREKENRKNLILDCAEKLFFKNGFNGTSIDDIANLAEYSKGTVYLHFKSKEEILSEICLRAIKLLYKLFISYSSKENEAIRKLEKIGQANFDFMNNYNDYYQILQMYESMEFKDLGNNDVALEITQVNKQVIGLMVEIIATGQSQGTINKTINPLQTANVLAATSSGVFQWINNLKKWDETNLGFDINLIYKEYFDIMHRALTNIQVDC